MAEKEVVENIEEENSGRVHDLEVFLGLANVGNMTEEIYVNKRLGSFVVRPMSLNEHTAYKKRCRVKTKKGSDFDGEKFNLLIAENHIVKPDFSNSVFLKKAGYMSAYSFFKDKFMAGEIAEIAEQICKVSGFDLDGEDTVEEAKN